MRESESRGSLFRFQKPNGIFIVFGDYQEESRFPEFLAMLEARLGALFTTPDQYPYAIGSEITFPGGAATASFRDDIGCFLRVDASASDLADHIMDVFNAETR